MNSGVPPIWSPPPTTPILKPDSGPRYVDQNTDRNPASPLDSLVLAVQTYQQDFNFAAIDVVSDRRPLRKLYGFVAGEPESFEFGVDIVGNTAIFVRIEKQTREELPSTTFHGFRQAFEEQYTKLSATAKGSTSHHRIVQYTFGGLSLLVRSAVDAYLEELVEGADSSVVTDRRDPLDHVNFVQNLSLGGRVATPSEAENEFDGRVTVVQGGQKVPNAAVLELTTRSTSAKRPMVIEQKMADLWLSQTPTFIEAYHRGVGYKANQHGSQQGKFEDIKVRSMGDLLIKWETDNAKVLGKLATVLRQVVLGVKKARSPCIVRYGGQGASQPSKPCQACPRI